MSLWYCEKCEDVHGPVSGNCCTRCGWPLAYASIAAVQRVLPEGVIGEIVEDAFTDVPALRAELTRLRTALGEKDQDTVRLFSEIESWRAVSDRLQARAESAEARLATLVQQLAALSGSAEKFIRAADLDACLNAGQEGS